MTSARPPRLAERLLGFLARPDDRFFVLSDLREEFVLYAATKGAARARRWYRRQVAASVAPLLRRRLTRSSAPETLMAGVWRDVSQGARAARRSPGFSLLVICVTAIGVGATTAVFSVAMAVMLVPLPFEDPDRLIAVRTRDRIDPATFRGVSGPDYFDYVERMTSLSGLFGYETVSETLSANEGPARRVTVAAVGHTSSAVLGRGPALGRGFLPEEDTPDGEHVVIISDRLWRDRFDASPDAVGSDLVLDGRPHAIVGVMPQRFAFPSADVDLWRPLRIGPTSWRRAAPILSTIGRMRPGTTLPQVEAEFAALSSRLAEEHPESNEGREAFVVSLSRELLGSAPRALFLLGGAVGMLLLLSCSNIANLVLARSVARREEMALRLALGANRPMLVRQIAAESLVLATLGGGGGFGLAWFGTEAAVVLGPQDVYRIEQVAVDVRVLLFAVVVSLFAGLAFGAIPALLASRSELKSGLAPGAGRKSRREGLLGRALIAGQVAIAMVLVISAGLFGRSLGSLLDVDPGFDASGLLAGRVDLPDARYPTGMNRYPEWPEILQFYERAQAELRAIPGVTQVALGSYHPLHRSFLTEVTLQEEVDVAGEADSVVASPWTVDPEYVATSGMQVVAGRGIETTDRHDAPRVALVNEAFVRRHLRGRDPLGMQVGVFGRSAQIVGVVSDVTSFGLREPPPPTVYQPAVQAPVELLAFLVRTEGPLPGLAPSVREAIRRVDPDLAIYELRPMTEILRELIGPTRFNTVLAASFGGLALIIAAVGILGVLAQSVERRIREIGVRIALGAQPRHVLLHVIGEALGVTTVGLLIGGGLGFASGTLMEGFLFGVGGTDPATFVAAAALLAIVAVVAAWRPAMRAANTDPIQTLRRE